MVLSRPARTHVLPAPQNPDGIAIAPIRGPAESGSAAAFMPDNGQVERMNRTIKDATVKRFYYQTHDQLREHLANFVAAYNFAKRLKTLKGLTPYEFICKCWAKEPQRFTSNPHHQIPGPNT
jgi:hypothetical protein